jgi:uncharacterized RDD family membrane protein YckC
MQPDWYYAHNNEQKGPVTGTELLALERSGLVRPSTLVWKAGMAAWEPWSSLADGVRAAAGQPLGVEERAPAIEDVAVCAYSGQVHPVSLMVKYGDRWVALEHKEAFLQSLREGAPVARMAGVGELQYVGFWWRLLAQILDMLVLMVPCILVAMPYYYMSIKKALQSGATASVDPLHEFKTMDAPMIVAYVVAMVGNFLIPALYETWMVGKFGTTVGKLAVGARVVKAGGEALTYLQALGRSGAKLLNVLIWVVPGNIAMIVGSVVSFGTGVQSGVPEDVPVAMLVGLGVMMLWFVVGGFGYYMAGWTRRKQALHDLMARTVVVRKNPR